MRRGARRRHRLLAPFGRGRLAPRLWLPIVNPPFHGSFGHRLARNSFEPYGLIATGVRVSPPHGEVIPSIETDPGLVLEALILLHYRLLKHLDPGRMVKFDQTSNPSRGVLASVREKLHPLLTTSTGSRVCHGGGGVLGTSNRCLDEVDHAASAVLSCIAFPPAHYGAVSPH